MIKNVYIRTRPGDNGISDSLLVEVGDIIRKRDLYIIRDTDEIDASTLILALGGDGTMLSAIHLAAESRAFVTGFNYGNLGYLVPDVATTGAQLTGKLDRLIYDLITEDDIAEYKVTNYELPLLNFRRKFRGCHDAVNDFYFVPAANGSAADFKVSIGDKDSYFETKSSGIVISTPFGSTGLALSAGGSILSPNSGVLEVVPMLPHTLTSRPIIFPDSDKITVSWDRKVNIFADGRRLDDFGEGKVVITCKKRTINLVQPIDWNFFNNLKLKMGWHT